MIKMSFEFDETFYPDLCDQDIKDSIFEIFKVKCYIDKEKIKIKKINIKDVREEWINCDDCKILPMTNAQSRFADFLFENKEELFKVGNQKIVFDSIYKFLKFYKDK